MDLERLLARTLTLQAIPAPTFSEAARSNWIHQEFLKLGLSEVEQDPISNVYARIPGGEAPPLIITAHLDTVFPVDIPLDSQRSPDRLRGPGIGDNALALAALLELAEDLPETSWAGDIWLIANVGEEGLGNLLGMRQVVARFGEDVTAYIILEGLALGHVYHQGLPVRRIRISAEGPGGHSWIHHGRPSAIHALIQVTHAILNFPLPQRPKTSLNLGNIHGGTSINTIARQAYVDIDLRSESESHLDEISDFIVANVEEFAQDGISLQLRAIGERPGGGLEVDHPLVQAAQRALLSVGETQPVLEAGSTDASVPLSMGFPAVCVGLTRGGGAHSVNEFLEIPPIQRGYQSVLNLIAYAFELELKGDRPRSPN
jgi:acetylornithine deacetylase/succinyl-diaminopimelate desuccinylase-like protein